MPARAVMHAKQQKSMPPAPIGRSHAPWYHLNSRPKKPRTRTLLTEGNRPGLRRLCRVFSRTAPGRRSRTRSRKLTPAAFSLRLRRVCTSPVIAVFMCYAISYRFPPGLSTAQRDFLHFLRFGQSGSSPRLIFSTFLQTWSSLFCLVCFSVPSWRKSMKNVVFPV